VRHGIERGHFDTAVDILAERNGQMRRRILKFIGFKNLAQADQLTRENSANSIVSAAEGVISQQQIFTSVQAINVAIMHPERAEGSAAQTHTEDVLEFRKGPNKRFAHHIT